MTIRVISRWAEMALYTPISLNHWMCEGHGPGQDSILYLRQTLRETSLSLSWPASSSLKNGLHGASVVDHSLEFPWLYFFIYFGREVPPGYWWGPIAEKKLRTRRLGGQTMAS